LHALNCHQYSPLKTQFNGKKLPVIFINDHYNLWQADLHKIIDVCRNELSQPIFEVLLPEEDDLFLIKPKHSAFYETALNTLLHRLKVTSTDVIYQHYIIYPLPSS
jgi:isochorismate hydrolase